jgi:hypothetical protein
MSSQRFVQQVENIGALKDLVDLVKNPAAIIAAHEEARKQLSLTTEAEEKLSEAKAFIAKHADLSKAITAAKADLEAARNTFQSVVSKTKEEFAQKEEQLNGAVSALNVKSVLHEEASKALSAAKVAFAASMIAFDKERADVLADINFKMVKANKAKEENDAKASFLAQLESDLKAKVAKLRVAADGI